VEKIEEYKSGHRPQRIASSSSPMFFDPTTGEPVVWYSRGDGGQIELFDLMGFHPQTGEELSPVTREVVDAWKQQSAKVVRRVPLKVDDPEKYGFFDQTTGAAKVWYSRSDSGDYDFMMDPVFIQDRASNFKSSRAI
jgi:hypothetical protein